MKETAKEKTAARQKASEIALSKSEAEQVFQRMSGMLKHIASVPKSEVDKREAAYRKRRKKRL